MSAAAGTRSAPPGSGRFGAAAVQFQLAQSSLSWLRVSLVQPQLTQYGPSVAVRAQGSPSHPGAATVGSVQPQSSSSEAPVQPHCGASEPIMQPQLAQYDPTEVPMQPQLPHSSSGGRGHRLGTARISPGSEKGCRGSAKDPMMPPLGVGSLMDPLLGVRSPQLRCLGRAGHNNTAGHKSVELLVVPHA